MNKKFKIDRRKVKTILINGKYEIFTDAWVAYNTVGDGLKQGLEFSSDLPHYVFEIMEALKKQ